MDILNAIGSTSIVRLRQVVPPNCADVFVKLEWENPTRPGRVEPGIRRGKVVGRMSVFPPTPADLSGGRAACRTWR